jgi:FkbM family methyltransferase
MTNIKETTLWQSLRRIKHNLFPTERDSVDGFLKDCKGVIHVGANLGQERDAYASLNLNVLWIEPIPEIYKQLESNIRPYKQQKALEALVADTDGAEFTFNISNAQGVSSSIFDFDKHKEIWPDVHYERKVTLISITLNSLFSAEKYKREDYDALFLDTQGAELLVLKGSTDILPQIRYVKTEAADFSSYAGGCTVNDLSEFLGTQGFTEMKRVPFAQHESGGQYYDVVYKRDSNPKSGLVI